MAISFLEQLVLLVFVLYEVLHCQPIEAMNLFVFNGVRSDLLRLHVFIKLIILINPMISFVDNFKVIFPAFLKRKDQNTKAEPKQLVDNVCLLQCVSVYNYFLHLAIKFRLDAGHQITDLCLLVC